MKAIIAILIMLATSNIMAQTKVVVVPLGGYEPHCLISGKGVECAATPAVIIPLNLVLDCNAPFPLAEKTISYAEYPPDVLFDIGSTVTPYLWVSLRVDYGTGATTEFNVSIRHPDSTFETIVDARILDGCAVPNYFQTSNNFSAAGSEWAIKPVFFSTATTVTLESLIFVRQ